MKIVFFIGSMLLKGGSERVIANLINDLKFDNEITLITIWKSQIAYKIEDINIISLDDFETTVNNLNNKKTIFAKIKNYIKRIKKYKHLSILDESDIIISFLPIASFISLACKKKTPIIIAVRNDPKIEYQKFIYNFLMKRLYKKADGIVFQTQEAKDYFKNIICNKNTKCKIIFNPVNNNFIEKSYNGIRNKNVVSVGRLEEQKNFPFLIRAFKKFHNIYPDYTLNIYGEGSQKEELLNLIKKLDLKDFVIMNGRIEDVKERIYMESMFILPSNYEGMPNALIEALCLGIPCISTDCPCGGPRSLIKNNENGILVEINNENEMVEAMCKIASNKDFSNYIGNNASKLSNQLNINVINKQWINFIYEIKNKNEKQQ